MNAIRTKRMKTMKPRSPARLRAIAASRPSPPATARGAGCPGRSARLVPTVWATGLLFLRRDPNARIQPAIQQVREQVGDHHRGRDDQEDALHHRVVALVDAVLENPADPLVLEQRLDEQRTADDESGGDGDLG